MLENSVIVYVEDDTMSRQIMAFLLKQVLKLPNVTILEDSSNFMEVVTSLSPVPDLFLLDIHMLPVDGFAMLEMLRSDERFSGAKIIALTASVMDDEVQKLKAVGFDSCIAKPIDSDTFPGLIERILNGEAIWRVK